MSDPAIDSELAALVVAHAPCWLLVVDGGHNVLLSNPAFTERFGEPADRPCYTLVRGREQPCEPCVAVQALQTRAVATTEQRVGAAEPAGPSYRVRAVPLDADGDQAPRVLLLALDLGREVALAEELSQVERLASVGLTTAGLAHTIKNILAGLEGGKYLMSSGLEREDAKRIAGAWEMVEKYLEQVGELVGNMLRYASAAAPQPEPIQPESLIDDVMALYQSRAEMIGIAIERDMAATLEPVTMDVAGIHGCLANFVANAIDACAWDPAPNKKHCIRLSAAPRPGGGVAIAVSDNGKGIPWEDQHRVLRSSFTTKGIRGTGLGLLLSKKVVEEHGGAIHFRSTPGQGSTFTIELPTAPAPKKGP